MDGLEKIVEALQDIDGKQIDIDGESFVTRQVFRLPKEHQLDEMPTIETHTLSSIVDYIDAEPEIVRDDVYIHVVDQKTVRMVSKVMEPRNQRMVPIVANLLQINHKFDQFISPEMFIIWLQSGFEKSSDRDDIVKIAGGLKSEVIGTSEDDGISQTATIQAQITKMAKIDIPNPVVLEPYRTFSEVEQPESKFVFRLHQHPETNSITVGLFEADGNAWIHDAISNIKDYLNHNTDDYSVIG